LIAEEIALDTFRIRHARPDITKPRRRGATRRSALTAPDTPHRDRDRKERRTPPAGLTVIK
jgi:hypothetical protein